MFKLLKFVKKIDWYKLKDINLLVSQVGFFFFPNNFFLQIIDESTQHLTSTGIMDRMVKILFKNRNEQKVTKKFKILTMKNLNFGFIIWLWSCFGTFVVFVIEILFWIVLRRVKATLETSIKPQIFTKVYPMKYQENDKMLLQEILNEKRLKWLKNTFVVKH